MSPLETDDADYIYQILKKAGEISSKRPTGLETRDFDSRNGSGDSSSSSTMAPMLRRPPASRPPSSAQTLTVGPFTNTSCSGLPYHIIKAQHFVCFHILLGVLEM